MACLERGEMEPFPSASVRPKRPAKIQRVQLHCDCCLPEDGEEPMAFCQKCRKWFHKSCQSIPDVVFDRTFKLNWFVAIVYRSSELAVILSKSCKILYLSPPNITENCQFNCSVDYVIERTREGGRGAHL